MSLPAGGTTWDVAIVGAGVTGAVAAALLTERGYRVLLIEKSSWPREKVCGGCLTAAAVSIFREAGISLDRIQPIRSAVWHAKGRSMRLDTPGEFAILRSDLDAQIVAEAVRRGCHFLPGVSAQLLPDEDGSLFRSIRLQSSTETATIRASTVLAADGIAGTLLANETWAAWQIDRQAWIGVATTCSTDLLPIPPHEIHMNVGNSGYAGLVHMNETQMHLAAALDPTACKSAGGPAMLVPRILREALGRELSADSLPKFRGTGPLTRKRAHLGGHRVLAIGDACGYIEPFTGEGIAWAAAGAREVASLLPMPGDPWPIDLPRLWKKRHYAIIASRQRWCRGMRPMMRHPAWAPLVITAANTLPSIANWIATQISQPQSHSSRSYPSRPRVPTRAAVQGVAQ